MRPKTIVSIVSAAAALGTAGIVATGATASSAGSAASAQSAKFVRHVEGPITAIDRATGTFTVRDREHRNILTAIKVTPSTRFDNLAGFGALRTGQSIDVRAVRANGTLTATKVERGGSVNSRFVDNRRGSRFDDRNHHRFDDRNHHRFDDRGRGGGDRGDDRGRGHDG